MYKMKTVIDNSWRHDYFFVERRKEITTFPEFLYFLLSNEDEDICLYIARELFPGYKRSKETAIIAAHSVVYAANVMLERLNCWGVAMKIAKYTKIRRLKYAHEDKFYVRDGDTVVQMRFDPHTQTYKKVCGADMSCCYTIGKF